MKNKVKTPLTVVVTVVVTLATAWGVMSVYQLGVSEGKAQQKTINQEVATQVALKNQAEQVTVLDSANFPTVKKPKKLKRISEDVVAKTPAQSTPVKKNPNRGNAPATPNVEQIIRDAARRHGVDENHLLSIARCESGLNPKAVNYNYNENGYPSGLFQHLSGYYPARAKQYGYSTDVFDAYSNANVTAAMFANGQSYLWECK